MWHFSFKSFLKEHRETLPVKQKMCDSPGCTERGEFKAPKSRDSLREYFWFCLEHVRDYNAKWDFFKGMTPGEIETHVHKTYVWDRPTWRATQAGFNEERLKQKVYARFAAGESVFGEFSMKGEGEEEEKEAHIDVSSIPHPAVEALATLGLQPPIVWDEVKARYKTLAKKFHPDTNKDKDAEEELKKINMAYGILKLSYQHYSTLDDKT